MEAENIDDRSTVVPTEEQQKMEIQRRVRNQSLANQLALIQYRGSTMFGQDEDKLCVAYGLTSETLALWKKRHAKLIETQLEEYRFGKFKIIQTLGQTLSLREVMVRASLEGDTVMAARIEEALTRAERVVPLRDIKQVAELMKYVNEIDNAPTPEAGKGNVQINISPALQRAEQDLEERRKKIIDVKEE